MKLVLVVALACEARPVIARWKLQGEPSGESGGSGAPFRLYRGEELALVISGVGKVAAAAATAWAALRLEEEGPFAFVNFGCAGHRHRPPGEVLLAHEVRDEGSGRKWFPPLVFSPQVFSALAFSALGGTSRVITVDRPETSFADDALYEMEASGFVETASRFATAELVQCVKFVSDNAVEPAAALDAGRIEELAEGALEGLAAILEEVSPLAGALAGRTRAPAGFEEMLGRWRFSVTQRRQLRRLLQRWQALVPEGSLPAAGLERARSGREALEALRGAVEAAAKAPGGPSR